MQKKERIAQLLSNGLDAETICSIVGVVPAYLTALKGDEEFKELLTYYAASSEEETSAQIEDTRLDDKYVALEHKVLKSLTCNAELLEPNQAIKLLDNIGQRNDKRRSGLKKPEGEKGAVVHISLNLPQHAIPVQPSFTITAQNEVVGVDSQSLAPMATDGVKELIQQHKDNKPSRVRMAEEAEILEGFDHVPA